ncbi:MAG: hypothetical protein AAF633_20685 [Chloroflexota bacterium]
MPQRASGAEIVPSPQQAKKVAAEGAGGQPVELIRKETLPRADFDRSDYEAEICGSARLIEKELKKQGLTYWVETLILPYGSGYSYAQPDPQVHPGIAAACCETHISMIAGIPQGRGPFPVEQLSAADSHLYMGRIGPLLDSQNQRDPDATVAYLDRWANRNEKG